MTLKPPQQPPEAAGFAATLRREWVILLIVAGLAAAVRVPYLVQLAGTPFLSHPIMDALGYDRWAREIASGGWLGGRVFYQEPLYPYILALIYSVSGAGLVAACAVQTFVGVVNCVLVATLAARLLAGRAAALIAGLLLAFYGPVVFYEGMLLKTVWEIFFLLVMTHLLLSASDGRRWWTWLLAGVVMALLGLVRGNALVYVPFVLLWIVLIGLRWKRPALAAALAFFLVGAGLPLAGVMARNYAVGGDFVLTSSHVGFNFYIGNNPASDGTYKPEAGVREDPQFEGDDARAAASRAAGRELKPSEVSAWWFSKSVDFITGQPGKWLKLVGVKFLRYFNADEVLDTWSPAFFAGHAPLLRVAFLSYAVLAPLAMVGLVVLAPRGPRVRLLHLLVVASVLSVVIFYVFGRYRVPVVPLFAVAAAGGIVTFAGWVRQGGYLKPLLAIVALGGAACVVDVIELPSHSTPGEYRASEHVNLGAIYFAMNDLTSARSEYEKALARSPNCPMAYVSLAVVAEKEGRPDSALEFAHKAIKADESCADAHYLLAGLYFKAKKANNAVLELDRAVKLRPGYGEAWRDLGLLLTTLGQWDRALATLRKALEFEPESFKVWYSIGLCCSRKSDFRGARSAWLKAVNLAPTPEIKAAVRADLQKIQAEMKP
jgi:Tfp pilus assembly protein PilF